MPILILLSIYILPGFTLSRVFRGKIVGNPLLWLFLSFILTPFLYTTLAYLDAVSFQNFLILEALLLVITSLTRNRLKEKLIDFDLVLPKTKITKSLILIASIFWLMNILPRIGLLFGQFPIGDDMHRIGKTVSVAESQTFPVLYHFPATRMTIYYFVTVASGLTTKFSNNEIPANVSWFIQVSVWVASILYFLVLCAENIFTKTIAKRVFILSVSFFSGYEFYVALLKGINPLNFSAWTDLEWWTDWFTKIFNIHFQISSFYTLSFWVPQHLFAGVLGLNLYLFIKYSKERPSPLTAAFIGLTFATIFGYSVFVFLTLAAAYLLTEIYFVAKKPFSFKSFLGRNAIVGLVFLVFSFDLLRLYLGSEKGSWFELRLNAFWFLDNSSMINKILNLAASIPTLLTVELGGMFLVFVYSISRIIKGEKEKGLIFWHLCILLPFTLMFFIRAADDNNISLRSTIPSLIGLAIFSGKVFDEDEINRHVKKVLLLLLILGIPTTVYLFSQRLVEQFTFGKERLDPIYSEIDRRTPLDSIILKDGSGWTDISVLSHRFTFKPLKEFSPTDKEYSAYSKIKTYESFMSSNLKEIQDFISKIKDDFPVLNKYRYFLLTENEEKLPLISQSKKYKLYSL